MLTSPQTYKLTLAYNGQGYFGFQRQPRKKTIQSELEKAFFKILREKIVIIPSGRTDTGVHALKQVCHFDVRTKKAKARLKKKNFLNGINSVLSKGISILACVKKSGFHARKNAQKKTYEYLILFSKQPHPFLEGFVWRISHPLDIQKIEKALPFLKGRHDFSAFCASDSTAKKKTREIFSITLSHNNPCSFFKISDEKFLRIQITGSGFLKQMVRNIVGTLVEVGKKKRGPNDLKIILKTKDRCKAGFTAPAKGLYLKKIFYA